MLTLEMGVNLCLLDMHMSQLCMDNSYILSSQALIPTDSYTHVSKAWNIVSWLDHIVSSADFHHCIFKLSPLIMPFQMLTIFSFSYHLMTSLKLPLAIMLVTGDSLGIN